MVMGWRSRAHGGSWRPRWFVVSASGGDVMHAAEAGLVQVRHAMSVDIQLIGSWSLDPGRMVMAVRLRCRCRNVMIDGRDHGVGRFEVRGL